MKCEHDNSNCPIHNFTPLDRTRYRLDCFVVSGVAVWIESAWQPDRCVLCLFVSEYVGRRSATAGRTPTQNALVGRSVHTRHDKTVAPACRPQPPRRRPGRQLRLAATPRSDVVRHENVNTLWTAVWSIGWLFRLCQTVSRLNSHRLARHRQDRLVVSGGRCELGIRPERDQLM